MERIKSEYNPAMDKALTIRKRAQDLRDSWAPRPLRASPGCPVARRLPEFVQHGCTNNMGCFVV